MVKPTKLERREAACADFLTIDVNKITIRAFIIQSLWANHTTSEVGWYFQDSFQFTSFGGEPYFERERL